MDIGKERRQTMRCEELEAAQVEGACNFHVNIERLPVILSRGTPWTALPASDCRQ